MARKTFDNDRTSTEVTREAARARAHTGPPRVAKVSQLVGNPANARYPDEDPEIQQTAQTMKTGGVGQLQEVVVVERLVFESAYPAYAGTLGDAAWVVIIGNRRLQAARLAGIESLNIRVADHLNTADAIEKAILVENAPAHRKALPPLLEAQLIAQRLAATPGLSQRALANELGLSHTYVKHRLDIRNLIPELQDWLRHDKIKIKAGRILGTLSETDQVRFLEVGDPVKVEALAELPQSLRDQFVGGHLNADNALELAEAARRPRPPRAAVNRVATPAALEDPTATPGPQGEAVNPVATSDAATSPESSASPAVTPDPVNPVATDSTSPKPNERNQEGRESPPAVNPVVTAPGSPTTKEWEGQAPGSSSQNTGQVAPRANENAPAGGAENIFTLHLVDPTPAKLARELSSRLSPHDLAALADELVNLV